MVMPGIKKSRNSEQGFALVVVIVIMLLISFLAAQLILNVRTELQVAFNAKSRVAGLSLAKAGVNLAIFRLLDKPLEYINDEYEFLAEGYEYDAYLETGRISYRVVNESGKIGLNKPNDILFRLLLDYMGLDDDEQEVVIDSLQDWQDGDDLYRINGAESETYEELDDPYIARNGKIMDPAEFFLINGTEKLAGRFKANEIFTVHNNSRKINFNSLNPIILDFITEGDEEKIKKYHEAQELYETLTAALALEILEEERFYEISNMLTYSSGSNKFYTIIARGEAGVTKEDLADNEENEEDADKESGSKKGAMEVTVIFELKGTKINYYSWEEGWS